MKRIVLPILLAATLRGADSHMPAMNAFTTESYTQLARSDANLILSPFNIATALSMALAGARGQTAQEIQSVLHIQYDSSYDAALGALLADLAKAGNIQGNELITANGLWVQKGLAIQPAFERTLADNYHAPATLVDFIANFEAARSQINAWTEEHTNQKIKNLFPAGSLDAQTRLVLTSAIYFYGKWQDPFITSSTQPAPFTLSAGGTTQANFMNQTSHFSYAETPSAQILEMRYAGTGIAFDVLLPKTVIGINGLEKSLTPENLTRWLASLSTQNVKVSLPKFRAESVFSLGKTLSIMGMPTTFSDKADFSGIVSKRRPGNLRGRPQGFRRCFRTGDRSRCRHRNWHSCQRHGHARTGSCLPRRSPVHLRDPRHAQRNHPLHRSPDEPALKTRNSGRGTCAPNLR
jgi:serpin B